MHHTARLLLVLLLVLPCLGAFAPDGPASRAGDVAPADDYAATLTAILQEVVTDDGRVRYDRLRTTHHDAFRRVLKAVEQFDAGALTTDAEKLAFWLNAYNVQMLQHIIEMPGVADVLAHAERFFKTPYRTAGKGLTLDQIEHVMLRREDGGRLNPWRVERLDPRIHVGLNCAAAGCPRPRRRAFTPANVQAELEAAMRGFANDPRHLRAEDDGFVLSSLLDWFAADFDRLNRPAGDFLLSYMAPTRPGYEALRRLLAGRSAAEIKQRDDVRYAYDWTLNAAR